MDKLDKILKRTSKRYRIYKHLPRDVNSIVPITLEIHPTNKCNTTCSFCAFSGLKAQEEIPYPIFVRLIDEVINLGIKSVVFAGGGEPCIYPNIDFFIQKLAANNIKVGIITNGLFVNDNIIKALAKCSWVRFSLLCSNEKDFSDLTETPAKNFNKICANIRKLTSFSHKNENLYVSGLYMSDTGKDDIQKLCAFIDLAENLHLDQIFIKKKIDDFKPNEIVNILYSDNLEYIMTYAKKHNIITNMKKFTSIETNIHKQRDYNESCNILKMNLMGLINGKGDYYPCLYQYVNDGIKYGNILHDSLSNILINRQKVQLQIEQQQCSFCRHWSLRSEIYEYKKSQIILKCNDPHSDFI